MKELTTDYSHLKKDYSEFKHIQSVIRTESSDVERVPLVPIKHKNSAIITSLVVCSAAVKKYLQIKFFIMSNCDDFCPHTKTIIKWQGCNGPGM